MAFPVGGGCQFPPIGSSGHSYFPAKRRTASPGDYDHYHQHQNKRQRHSRAQYSKYADYVAFKAADELPPSRHTPLHHPKPRPHPYHRYASPHRLLRSPEPAGAAAPAMERTASGHSIRSEPTERCGSTELLEDDEAAQRVRDHLAAFRRRNPDSKHERILRSIITPRRRRRSHHFRGHPEEGEEVPDHQPESDEYPLDNDALESIFSAANNLFFNGRLSQRVRWDWSHESAGRYDGRVIGTTALRRAAPATRGFETLIVLSSTILRDPRYSRRLLISTFLHELIHSYLFICCGFRARCDGGHTRGFREIAELIDEWAGKEAGLFLGRVEADLEMFKIGGRGDGGRGAWAREDEGRGEGPSLSGIRAGAGARAGSVGSRGTVYPCLGWAEHPEYAGGGYAAPGINSRFVLPQEMMVQHSGSGVAAPHTGLGAGRHQVAAHYAATMNTSGNNGGGRDDAWWRQRRTVRPVYVYPGDDLTNSYVYPNSMLQRP
ncbi:hypothetical protein VTK26DRAFT_3344 [Humicola hyalothermophila]